MKGLLDRLSQSLFLVSTLGLLGLYLYYFVHVDNARTVSGVPGLLEMLLLGVPVAVMFGGFWWLRESDIEPTLKLRVVGWTYGGLGAFMLANVATIFVLGVDFDVGERVLLIQMSAGVGLAAGLALGHLETRAIRQARARAETELEARQTEQERERLQLLNRYLRHEVLNGLQVIGANAAYLQHDAAGERRRRLHTISRRCRDIEEFVESIREILTASEHHPRLEAVDLRSVVQSEFRKVEASYDHVSVDADLPANPGVRADDVVGTVFGNLFENAARHSHEPVTITVSADRNEETTRIVVADDGPGIPESEREDVFEPAESTHGQGLYLARTLAELYGGRLELDRTGPAGTTFIVELMSANATDSSESIDDRSPANPLTGTTEPEEPRAPPN